jgi:hypothetical protein
VRISTSLNVHVADAIFIVALILVAGICVFTGIALPLGSFAADTFFLLGNAYRVAGGQVPHVDFSSPWGPVIFLIEAVGLRLAGMRPSGLGYANALFAPLIASWSFLVARSLWSPTIACLIGCYTLLLIAAPFSLGNNPMDFSYAMVYNRYAYAILGIVVLECVADALSDKSIRRNAALAVSTGVALALLVFLKISYAFVAVAVVALLPIAGSAGGMRRLRRLAGSFSLMLLLGGLYLRFDVFDMLQDLTMAANSRAIALKPYDLLGIFGFGNAALLILAILVARFRGAAIALLTITLGGFVLITNQQAGGFPLNAYAAVALIGTCVRSTEKLRTWPAGVLLLAAVCLLPVYEESAISLVSAAIQRNRQVRPLTVLPMPERGEVLTFIVFRRGKADEIYVKNYIAGLTDGLNLLRDRLHAREGVLSFDEFNEFNYILDLPPPRGGFAAAAYDYIFDDAAHPSAERFFGSAAYVLVPNYKTSASSRAGEDPNTLALLRLYGDVLRKQFGVVAESTHWVLWRRRQAPKNESAAGRVQPRLKTTE